MMIERFLRIVQQSPQILEQLQSKVVRETKLSATDLRNLAELVDLLGFFNHASKILQSQTSSCGALIPTLCALWCRLVQHKDKNQFTVRVCAEMMKQMVARFGSYLHDSKWLTCAVLDPRFRSAFCKQYEGFVTYETAKVRRLVFEECKKAYDEYNVLAQADVSNALKPALPTTSTARNIDDSFFTDVLSNEDVEESHESVKSEALLQSQFDRYASAAVSHCGCDIFSYIREHAMADFPRLIPAWRKFLCIPATSAPIECVFSTAGDVVTQDRCRLHGDVIEDLVYLKRNIGLQQRTDAL